MSVEGSIHEEASAGTPSIKSSLTNAESSRNRADSTGSHISERLESYDEVQEEQEEHDVEKQEQGAHVEYILVAEFEVDQGPLMEHQYPNAISGDEQ